MITNLLFLLPNICSLNDYIKRLCKVKEKAIEFQYLLNMVQQIRKRTEPEDIAYSLHLYFNGLSLRNTSKVLCCITLKFVF